ncbi:DUF1853 family protein [Photobacterium sp. SDRW27]|uniref:DUF1853 family protein n=1 Tax=Photobacterium obscurum TaxID=2829490 RepID=UPI0022437A8D|nr:DUF1853 family protein [Photobacterium obscurum]MCW8327568.1 DUF1853 family protein [Photobacterium obscurum]
MSLIYNQTTANEHARNTAGAVLHLPPLLTGHPFIADQCWLDAFRAGAKLPENLNYQGGKRLGFYYQWLWQQLILNHPDYELLGEELQLTVDKKTLGAIDFLVKNLQTEQIEHWEVAIKFYLAYEHSWPGPNARDNLDKKAKRMLTHQLMLSSHPAYKATLEQQYGRPDVRRLIMQGRLFYPAHAGDSGSDIELNPDAAKGLWCYSQQAQTLDLRRIAKPEWIAPPSFESLKQEPPLTAVTNPTMAVAPDNQIWFVMPEKWPHEK